MALRTLANLISEVQDEIPEKPQAKIVRSINKVLTRIVTEMQEPKRSTFTTKAKIETGTVIVTQDSTTATFSSTILSDTFPFMMLQVEGDENWFNLTYSSTTVGILSSAWAEDTNATATYTLVFPAVSFPSDVGRVLSIYQNPQRPLTYGGIERAGSWPWQVFGRPTNWLPYRIDMTATTPDDDKTRVLLWPAPDARMVFSYSYYPRIAFLTEAGATSQTIPLSDLWYEAICAGVIYHCWQQDDRPKAETLCRPVYEAALMRARGAQYPSAVIMPRAMQPRLGAYEQRPIEEV